MTEPMLWKMLLGLILLGALGYATAAWSAVLRAKSSGTPAVASWSYPGRETARLLVRQRTASPGADTMLSRIGVVLLPMAAMMAILVIPLGTNAITDLSVGVVWFNAMEVLAWAAVWMVGWGSNSVWGLVGANRFLAQGLAYELPHMFALITAGVGAGSLRVSDIADHQGHLWFAVYMPVAFVVFLLSGLAFSFSPPFAQAFGADIAGGAAAQLSGVDRLLLRTGRYLLLAAAAAMSVPLFLGGGAGPLFPGWVWMLLKTLAVLAVLVGAGHRLPGVRMERFTEISWLVLLPLTIVQALAVSIFVLLGWM
ncbi:NADH-quinone oxidoreductase subunit H [Paenarthrobacter sp. Z7-10]|uniref:complex I subunit 1 family protein n=1 Tax=Paenarthrobacter sp. Z7-10 TaxID=2787635 RepID=UPI0022A8EC13|nr:complex I subunit 1 family protein [Paenarthrobacter sp. Z7-10]MCZ2402538.1 NADH-quinone oxidoreductase subunit H [Paenarthrobacter sp. Z7-10]